MNAYDKALKQIRTICLDLPEACEVEAWGHPTFRAGKKMFAAFGGDARNMSLGMNVGFDRQEELLQDGRFFPTPYAAHQGWVSLKINNQTDWQEVRKLVREAYRQVALKRTIAEIRKVGLRARHLNETLGFEYGPRLPRRFVQYLLRRLRELRVGIAPSARR